MLRSFAFLVVSWAAGCAAPAPLPAPVSPPTQVARVAEEAPTVEGEHASPITFERMAQYPTPGWNVPRQIAYAPDGASVTFLQSDAGDARMALFSMSVATGETTRLLRAEDVAPTDKPLSLEEELRRERQRSRIEGITSYRWAKRADVMVLPLGGDVYVRDASGAVRPLTDTEEPEVDPQLCPTGERVAFARGPELYVVDVASGKERALTKGAPAGVVRGQSDFNGQEEFYEEHGFFWSPDCRSLLYLEVDERTVAELPILGYRGGEPQLMQQRYPRAGARNPSVRVGLVDATGGPTRWITWPAEVADGGYFGRFVWARDASAVFAQALRRDQKKLTVVRIDAATARAARLYDEASPGWVEFRDLAPTPDGRHLVTTREREGHLHLEVRDPRNGQLEGAVTSGDWDVIRLVDLSEDGRRAFFTATRDEVLGRHLYDVPLDGSAPPRRLTPEAGVHDVTLGPRGDSFVDLHSAIDRPPTAVIRGLDGALRATLPSRLDADFDALGIRPPELVSLDSPDGVRLYGALLRPRHVRPGARHPAVVMVYGGPGVQTVLNEWQPRLLWQHLADRGFFVFQLDNRGSSGRGPAFEHAIVGRLGEVELRDQLAGRAYLAALPEVDDAHIGIYGHSYGGFMAALAMLKSPGAFAAGIAGSPVTRWEYYDTGYTERYMGAPADNGPGYAQADLGALAKNLTGALFVLHALMDENVHFDNTAHLIDALVEADRRFDLLVFPGERHGYRSPAARLYAQRRVVDYLVEHLAPGAAATSSAASVAGTVAHASPVD